MGGRPPVFVGPIGYVGHQALATDLANFKTALATVKAEEGFITAVAPGSFARRQNQYYKSDEEFLYALAEALREEYKAIVDADLVLQLDDPGLPDTWDMANPEPSVDEYKKFAMVRVEALNHALRGLPEGSRWCLLDRGRQRPSRARVESLARRQAARRKNPGPERRQPRHQRRRAP
jgi:methionine synthase II (cobalamin-independent)